MKRQIVGIIATLAILTFFIWYITNNWQQFTDLRIVTPSLLIAATILCLINLYATGMLMSTSLYPLGVKLTQHESFGLMTITRFCKYIAPSYLSAAVRAIYLKQTYRLSYADFSSSFIVSNVVIFIVSGVAALSAFMLRDTTTGQANWSFIVVIVVALMLFGMSLATPFGKIKQWIAALNVKRGKKVQERFIVLFEGFLKIRSQPIVFMQLISWAIAAVISSALITYSLYFVLGYEVGVMPVLFISAVTSWGILISITPANIGVREGIMVIAAQIVGIPAPVTLAVALLERLVVLVVASLASGYYTPRLLRTSIFNIGSLKKR